MGQRTYDFDADLVLKDAGLVAATGAAQVGAADKVLDVGAGRFEGVVVIDMTAIETDSSNEEYDVLLQGSSTSAFAAATTETLAQMNFGHTSVRQGTPKTTTTGRYEMPFTNEQDDVVYRYLRLFHVVAGTVATGLNYSAFIAKTFGR